jgi:hypothetical protein
MPLVGRRARMHSGTRLPNQALAHITKSHLFNKNLCLSVSFSQLEGVFRSCTQLTEIGPNFLHRQLKHSKTLFEYE